MILEDFTIECQNLDDSPSILTPPKPVLTEWRLSKCYSFNGILIFVQVPSRHSEPWVCTLTNGIKCDKIKNLTDKSEISLIGRRSVKEHRTYSQIGELFDGLACVSKFIFSTFP